MSATLDVTVTSDESAERVSPRRTRIDSSHPGQSAVASEPTASEAGEAVERGQPAPHSPPDDLLEVEEPTAEMIAAAAGENIDARREQLQLQVAQLAGHLRERLREVDRREAAINARASQLESDVRSSRMWLQERELAFQDRETELKRRIEELEEETSARSLEIKTPPIDQAASAAELSEREQQLQLREDEARERRFEVDRQAAALRHSQQVWQQEREREERQLAQDRLQLTRDLQQLAEQRDDQLRAAELLLTEHSEQLQRDQASFLQQRQAWEEQRLRQGRAIDELRAAAEAELSDRRSRLAARQEWIERQKGGLEQVRDEALRLHRQSLEMRLLAEQLWAQISGALAPAEITHTIAQLRLKLSEQYRLEEQQLAERRQELLKLSEDVAQQHRELAQLRGGLRDWVTARQTEIEQQASTLVERELSLDAQHDEFRRERHEWQSARRHYEQQIRDLTAQLRSLPVAA